MALENQIYIDPFGLLSMLPILVLHHSSVSRQRQLNVKPLLVSSLEEAKRDSVVVLVVLMGCWCGQKTHLKSSVWKSVSMMGNFTVEGKANLV